MNFIVKNFPIIERNLVVNKLDLVLQIYRRVILTKFLKEIFHTIKIINIKEIKVLFNQIVYLNILLIKGHLLELKL